MIEQFDSWCGEEFDSEEERHSHELHCPACEALCFDSSDEIKDEPVCLHCGKPLYDFSDIGCGHCDQRSPEWGIV